MASSRNTTNTNAQQDDCNLAYQPSESPFITSSQQNELCDDGLPKISFVGRSFGLTEANTTSAITSSLSMSTEPTSSSASSNEATASSSTSSASPGHPADPYYKPACGKLFDFSTAVSTAQLRLSLIHSVNKPLPHIQDSELFNPPVRDAKSGFLLLSRKVGSTEVASAKPSVNTTQFKR